MSLRRKLIFKDLLILLSLIAVVGACMGGLLRQRRHVQASLDEYSAVRLVESADAQVVSAKAQLDDKQINFEKLATEFKSARTDLREYKALLLQYKTVLPSEVTAGEQDQARLKTQLALTSLSDLVTMLDPANASPDVSVVSAKADEVIDHLSELLRVCNVFLNKTQLASDRDLHMATLLVAVIAGATALIAALASLWQYQRIMVPLRALRRWCRGVAKGDFSQPYLPRGDREFVELGNDVNKMADELNAFYRQLEEMVRSKSKELVRSERLASVGYLAAGVAHEINNPLNIMSGYAELSVKRLRRSTDPWVLSDVLEALAIIRDEAFRCKEITGKLLSLAKGGSDGREVVSLAGVVHDMTTMVQGLKQFAGRRVVVEISDDDALLVRANATEMKQVMLNLIVNALEAVAAGGGRVVVWGATRGEIVELAVSDNGRGMSRQTLEQVFEPFYTDKRGAGEPGTGLGLSITHAIVTNHGGKIRAESDGAGYGSRFTIQLPVGEVQAPSLPAAKGLTAREAVS
jgi:two-component system, NtrC family, sensor kinase